jgi:hypothetical protein
MQTIRDAFHDIMGFVLTVRNLIVLAASASPLPTRELLEVGAHS